MKVQALLPDEDVQIIKDNLALFKEMFTGLDIVSENFVVNKEDPTEEWEEGSNSFDFKEVVMEISSMNNFWALAKSVQIIKSKMI
jgi:hypothetical protein